MRRSRFPLFGRSSARTRRDFKRRPLFQSLERRLLMAGNIWSQRGGDAGHASYADVAVDPATITEAWFQELNYTQSGTGSWRERAVAIDEAHVYRTALEGYAPSGTYHVMAYDVETGTQVWHNALAGGAFEGVSEPSVSGGIVYVNRAGHSGISGGGPADWPWLYGFDAQTGTTRLAHTYEAQWGSNERPVIEGDQLIVENGYFGGISGYEASTLTEQWFVGRSAAYDPPHAALNGQFAFAFGDEVYRRSDGARLADINHPADSSSESAPIVTPSGDVLYSYTGYVSGNYVRGVASFDGASHAHQWSFQMSAGPSFKAAGNGLVAVVEGSDLHILNESDGSLIRTWNGPSTLSEVVLTQTHAFTISLNASTATVHAVDLQDGTVDWTHSQYSPGGSALVEMALGQGHLILSDRAGVRAFRFSGDAPALDAVDDAATTAEDTSKIIAPLSNDVIPPGSQTTITSVTDPSHGTVVLHDDGTLTYLPDENFHGEDSFHYTVQDETGQVDTAMVSLTVTPVNDEPQAVDAVFALEENTPDGSFVGAVRASDVDGDDLSFALSGAGSEAFAIDPVTGVLSVAESTRLDYETQPVFDLTLHVSDGRGGQATASLQVNLTNVLEVQIDILPEDPANRISLSSKTVEVAILTNADLHPLTMLDLGSLRLRAVGSSAGAGVESHRKHGYRYEQRDVNGDGLLDLVLKFDTSDTGLQAGDTAVELEGRLLPEHGGEAFRVTQEVEVYNGRGKGKKG